MPTFTYVSVTSITPNSGPFSGGTAVTITGFGFDLATSVTFDGVTATSIVYVSNTTITAVTPAHSSGSVTVAVVGVDTLPDGYAYTIGGVLLPPIPYPSPVIQKGDLEPVGIDQWRVTNPWFRWFVSAKDRIENPVLGAGSLVPAENVIGVLAVVNIPQLPSSQLDFTASPRLLGRSSFGAGVSEEIRIGPGLTLALGILTLAGAPGGFTQGSVIFAGPAGTLAQDNSKFFWDDTNNRLGIGTNAPIVSLHIQGGDAYAVDGSMGVSSSTGTHVLNVFNSASGANTFVAKADGTVVVSGLNAFGNATGLSINMAAGGLWTPLVITSSGGTAGDTFIVNASRNVGIGVQPPDTQYRLILKGASATPTSPLALRMDKGAGAAFNRVLGINDEAFTVEYVGLYASSTVTLLTTTNDWSIATNAVDRLRILAVNGRIGVGVAAPTAAFHLKAGTTAASTAPLKFTSGSLLTAPEVGAMEFLTDDYFVTITTGAARKALVLTDAAAALTSGRVPFATTNGRLTDDADLTFATDTLSATKLLSSTSVSTPSLISTAALTVTPAAGSNLNVALSTTGDFAVNTDDLYVDTSTQRVGIGITAPTQALSVVGETDFYAGATLRGIVGPSSWATNFFSFQNATIAESASNFALSQDDGGQTYVNAASGKLVFFRVANGTFMAGNNNFLCIGANVVAADFPSGGSAGLVFKDGTVLSSMASNTAGLYAEDFGGTVRMCGIDEVGSFGQVVLTVVDARSTAQTAAVASVAAYTTKAVDASFIVSANVNVTTSTAHNFTVECAYTDETNAARVLTLPVVQLAGTIITAITNVTGAGPYEGVSVQIRCKASTTITIRTQAAGTYTTVTYNVEGRIQQVA